MSLQSGKLEFRAWFKPAAQQVALRGALTRSASEVNLLPRLRFGSVLGTETVLPTNEPCRIPSQFRPPSPPQPPIVSRFWDTFMSITAFVNPRPRPPRAWDRSFSLPRALRPARAVLPTPTIGYVSP